MALLLRPGDSYTADKVSWLLSAVMSHVPQSVSKGQVEDFLKAVMDSSKTTCSELGQLEA